MSDPPEGDYYEVTGMLGELERNRAPNMSTLSERMRAWYEALAPGSYSIETDQLVQWADEVAALEAELDGMEQAWDDAMERERLALERVHDLEAPISPDSPTDILKKNYEKLGMSSALVADNKYGKHTAFGYQRNDKSE